MGMNLFFNWFGKSLSELLAIKEKHYNDLSEAEQKELDKLIEAKQNEETE